MVLVDIATVMEHRHHLMALEVGDTATEPAHLRMDLEAIATATDLRVHQMVLVAGGIAMAQVAARTALADLDVINT